MKRIIAGATGFIGRYLVAEWLAQGYDVVVIGRDCEKIHQQFQDSVTPLCWNELSQEQLALFADCDAIVNLTGSNIAAGRWTAKVKQALYTSRIPRTTTLVDLLKELGDKAPVLCNANGIGIYGWQQAPEQGLPTALTEADNIDYQQSPDFLAHLARAWEQAALAACTAGVRVVSMRFGVVLGKEGGALPRMALPFHFFLGGPIGNGKQPLSWIALPDLVRAIDFVIANQAIEGPVNFTAPQCVTQKYFAKTLGEVLHRPSLLPTPAIALRAAFGDMADGLLLNGQHVVPEKLQIQGFEFDYPELKAALKYCYPSVKK